MQTETQTAPVSTTAAWTGRVISWLMGLVLVMSAVMKLAKADPVTGKDGFPHLQWDVDYALGLGLLELACAIVYLIPRSSIIGAILITGYLGGAVATHMRIGEAFIGPVIMGMLVWLGLVLRDERLRALLPLRKDPAPMSRLNKALAIIGTLVVFAVVFVMLQAPDFRVSRSAKINAPPAKVFAQVNDFHNWNAWSPWQKLDPDAKLTFDGPTSGPGAVFAWAGNKDVGVGSMTLEENDSNERIKIKLEFKEPYAGVSTAVFTFKPEDNQTAVTWTMTGRNDVVGRAICLVMNIGDRIGVAKSMDKMIGDQFEEGLTNLKSVAESPKKSE